MIDMKQIKENVSNKLKQPSEYETSTNIFPVTEKSTKNISSPPMAIGSTIKIKGDVTGNEDLIIHGRVDGDINLKSHKVIIGKEGKVNANIKAKQILIEGELNGDIQGEEKVEIRSTGNVLGNVVSPRVTLEDGAMFKGSIEMEPQNTHRKNNKSENQSVADKNINIA